MKTKALEANVLDYIPRVGEAVLVKGIITGWRANPKIPEHQTVIVQFENGTEIWAPKESIYEVEEWIRTKG